MDKKIFFCAGLPRSGSTLVLSILAQNPAFNVTGTNGILPMITAVRDAWHTFPAFQAMNEELTEKKKVNVLRSMLEGFFADTQAPNCIDKCRDWPRHMEMAARILQGEPKVIVTVRDVRDVLCSFEKLWRKTKDTRIISQEAQFPVEFQTLEGRCAVFSRPDQIVGSNFQIIKDCVTRGWRKQMYFMEYDRLTEKPKEVISEIYDFLKVPAFTHDFDNVQQAVEENDVIHIFKDLHKIRAKVAPQEPQWPVFMPKDLAKFYEADAEFWKKL